MKDLDNFKLVGTHHLMKKNEIIKEIDSFNPEIILIELCNGRITLIENPELQKKEYSLLGMMLRAIKAKAKKQNLSYGNDMITAYKEGKKRGIKIGLIDRPMVETKVFFSAIPLKEKIQFVKQLIKFKSKKIEFKNIIDELNDEAIPKILEKLKSDYPNTHYYLVSSRDEYMINKIKSYLYDYGDKRILCFVGKGHLEKIKEGLNA